MSSNGNGTGGGGDERTSAGHYRSILVGTDGSTTAARAVDRAVEVAQTHHARLTVLSAGRGAHEVLRSEAERIGDPGVELDLRQVTGDPAQALLDEASNGEHDLLVVGNKGLAGFRRLNPLGSVPGKISHHLTCNLLVVKTT